MRLRSVVLLGLLSASMTLAACQTMNPTRSGGTKVSNVCSILEPIYYSRNDTELTKRQVRELNAVWTRLCGGKK